MDTMRLLLAVAVHPGSIQDRDGARLVLSKLAGRFPSLRLIWADGGYRGQLADWVASRFGWVWGSCRVPRTAIALRRCPAAGWWKEPWLGWAGADG